MIDLKVNLYKSSIKCRICSSFVEITGDMIFAIQHIRESLEKNDPEAAELYIKELSKFIEKEAAR